MRFHAVALLKAILAIIAVSMSGLSAAEIRVVGSDLLGPEFFKTLTQFAGRDSLTVSVALDGSRPGLEALRAGRAQLGLISLPAAEESQLADLESLPIAWHRVVVVVPAALPLEQITFAQLAGIYGRESVESFHRWGDLGLTGDWAGSPITAHAPVGGTGLALEFFRRVVLDGRALKPLVGRYATTDDLAFRLAGDSRAIAIAAVPLPAATATKSLALAVRAGDPAFAPTPENIESGDYPLRLPVRVVFSRTLLPQVVPVVRFVLSEESGAQFERAGLVPLPSAARRRQLLALEKMERENLQK